MTKCLQYHYKIVRFKCYNNAEYRNSSSADSRLRTGGKRAWTTTTTETIRNPAGAMAPQIEAKTAPGAQIRRPAGVSRIRNEDIPRTIERPPAQAAATRRKAEALPTQAAATRRKTEALPARIAAIRRKTEVPPARNAAIPPPGERIIVPAERPVPRERRVRAAVIRLPREALPAPAAAPEAAATAVLPATAAGREKRKKSGAINSAFSRDFSL